MQSNSNLAQKLSVYITSKYGPEQLGLLRLLCSFSFFREQQKRQNLSKFLGLPMLSFEKVLKSEHGIIYTRNANRKFTIIRGRESAEFVDDILQSLSGFQVGKIRAEFKELNEFPFTPCNSLGVGYSVDTVFGEFDFDKLSKVMQMAGAREYFDDNGAGHLFTAYNDAKSLVDPVSKYKLLAAAHEIVVMFRAQSPDFFQGERGPALPFATVEELGAVFMGAIEKSVKPLGKKKLTPKIIELLQDTFPNGELIGDNFILYDEMSVFGFLGLPETNDLEFVKDAGLGVKVPKFKELSVQQENKINQPAQSECADGKDNQTMHELFLQALTHVERYHDQDINNLEPAEREVALFGTLAGKAAFEKTSTAFKHNLKKKLPSGQSDPKILIECLYNELTKQSVVKNPLDNLQIYLLAAGRIISWKGQIIFEEEQWIFK